MFFSCISLFWNLTTIISTTETFISCNLMGCQKHTQHFHNKSAELKSCMHLPSLTYWGIYYLCCSHSKELLFVRLSVNTCSCEIQVHIFACDRFKGPFWERKLIFFYHHLCLDVRTQEPFIMTPVSWLTDFGLRSFISKLTFCNTFKGSLDIVGWNYVALFPFFFVLQGLVTASYISGSFLVFIIFHSDEYYQNLVNR